jgi:hypothetical protein
MQWIEALINISALVGFVAVANLGGNPRSPTPGTNGLMAR